MGGFNVLRRTAVVLLVLACSLFCSTSAITTTCNSFANKCNVEIGKVVSDSNNVPIQLQSGSSYYLSLNNIPQEDVNLELMLFYGNVEVYIARNREPKPEDADFSNLDSGEKDFLRIPYQQSAAGPLNVLIRAYGGSANFNLLLRTLLLPVQLINSTPQKFHIDFKQNNNAFVKLLAKINTANVNSSIVVTSFTSEAPLLTAVLPASSSTPKVSEECFLKITPKTQDIGKLLDIRLQSNNYSIVSVIFQENWNTDVNPVRLANGQLQRDKIEEGRSHFYSFDVPADITGTVSFVLESIQGDADLFVNPSGKNFYHREGTASGAPDAFPTWTSQRPSGRDSVTVAPTDPNYVKNGAYFVSVFGYVHGEYTIRVVLDNVVMTLIENGQIRDSVSKGKYKYYKFFDGVPHQHIYFDLQPLSGDADLYIACRSKPTGDDFGIPSRLSGHFNFSSQFYLEDTVDVNPDDVRSCTVSDISSDQGNTYYIGVYGYSESTFSLTVAHSGGTRVLSPGVPTMGNVFKRLAQRYQIRSSAEAQDLVVRLVPQYGDCDLYVKMGGVATITNFDFKSSNVGSATDMIEIGEEDICEDCWINILVYGFETSRFTITATFTDTVINLYSGIAARGAVASDKIQYYTFETSQPCTLNTVLTMFSGDSPAIYMSTFTSTPNATSPHTVVKVRNSGDGAVPTLSLNNIAAKTIVYIGIGGSGGNGTYTVRAHEVPTDLNAPPSFLQLAQGVPQSDSISIRSPSAWLYYVVQAPMGHETIDIRATSLVGEIDLYIRKCTSNSLVWCAQHALPNTTRYSLTTETLDRDIISIHRNDASATNYIIGAYSTSYYSAYQISFGVENSILELQAGVAVMDHVGANELDYFSFYFDSSSKMMKISLTTISGDPDIFISTVYKRPTPGNSTWRSFRFGSDIVEIDPSEDSRACRHCTYYIAVYGSSEATYSLSVSVENTWHNLQDGIPSSGRVGFLDWNYYVYYNSFGSARDFHLTLNSMNGNADVYITLDGSTPSFSNFAYRSVNFFTSDKIDILHSDPQYAPCHNGTSTECSMRVGIFGFTTTNYVLSLTSNIASTLLQLGVTQRYSVQENTASLFRVLLSEQYTRSPYTFRISVTPESGHVSMIVTCGPEPVLSMNESMWTLRSIQAGDILDIPSISVTDNGCLRSSGSFYVSVLGDSAATFSILASMVRNSTVLPLSPTIPSRGNLKYHNIDYFYVRPGDVYNDARLMVTVLQGDVDLYIGKDWESRPKLSNGDIVSYVAKSSTVGDEDLTLNHDKLQDWCKDRNDCYIIVAVVGSFGAASSSASSTYSLLMTWKDSMITLENGIPRKGVVSSGRMEYYKFTLTQVGFDVRIALAALTGDPDVYIGMKPIYHPTKNNFTWAQALFGADMTTVQYSDIAKHCVPNPSTGKACDFFLGVYGWQNSSYSITAKVDDGFLSPTLLIDQMPQSGQVDIGGYQYYKYFVSVEPPSAHSKSIPLAIKFILTPSDGGDVDLYVKFAEGSNRTEPGKTVYDYKSAGWSSVSEQVEVQWNMPHYCLDCVVYIAVYGYTKGSYSIQATSTGIATLQAGDSIGGTVRQGQYVYYSYYNQDSFAEMTISLTTINGDADLYVIARKPTDKTLKLPSRTDFTWRSLNFGSDLLHIDYDDAKFCSNCEYIVAVAGYENCTYTLTLTSREASMIRLAPNRPVNVELDTSSIRYFSTMVSSSEADITLSLTPLNTGSADMYVQIYNYSAFVSAGGGDRYPLPDPYNYETYSYTTEGTEDNHIFLPGPHGEEDIIVITVKALSNVRFVMVAASNNRPVILQSGIPQNHFVDLGQNEYFRFFPNTEDDVRITITARSGDPDLFISTTDPNPHCVQGATYWQTDCRNYTWSSRMFYTDQIIISRDVPCTAVLPTTIINPSCNAWNAFPNGVNTPFYIGVYGYRASKFSVLAVPVGQHIQLIPGQPQLSTTAAGFICSQRSEANGQCLPTSSVTKKVQASYFSFHVAHPGNQNGRRLSPVIPISDVMLTIIPNCNATRNHNDTTSLRRLTDVELVDTCAPGCACNPLKVYVNSCPASKCLEKDRKPSEIYNQHKASLVVQPGSGSTLFISSSDLATPGVKSAFCDPAIVGEDCSYFVAVTHASVVESATFTITARTPGDVNLVPCDAKAYPDGVKVIFPDVIKKSDKENEQHYYEVCSQQSGASKSGDGKNDYGDMLIVELEQCFGSTSLYACADDNSCKAVLPTTSNWGYYADHAQTCIHTWGSRPKDSCTKNGNGKATLRLPPRIGSYFIMTEGTGVFNLQIRTTVKGIDLSPKLVYSGIQELSSGELSTLTVTGNTATFSWRQSRVLMPGLPNPFAASGIRYMAHVFDKNVIDTNVDFSHFSMVSPCALEYIASMVKKGLQIVSVPLKIAEENQDSMTYTLQGLSVSSEYTVVVLAICDSSCLRQLSKVISSARVLISCSSGEEDCKPQQMLYRPVTITTTAVPDKTNSNDDTGSTTPSSVQSVIIISIIVLVIVVLVMAAAGYYWYKIRYGDDGPGFDEGVWGSIHGIAEMMDFRKIASGFQSNASSFHGDSSTHSSHSSHSTASPYEAPRGYHAPGSEATSGVWSSMTSAAKNFSSLLKPSGSGSANTDSSGIKLGSMGKGYKPLSAQQQKQSAFVVEDDEDVEISL